LHLVLGAPLDLADPIQMGERDLAGGPLPSPDVFDIDGEVNTRATVDALHARGKKVICYFDAGVYETYRSDAAAFEAMTPRIWGKPDKGWDGSYWLDIRRIGELQPIVQSRIQVCKDKGFDAVRPDEMTAWSNDTGFPITYQDQLVYNRLVAQWVHAAGMSVGLLSDIDQAADLVDSFDWTLNEECFEFNECLRVTDTSGLGRDGKLHDGLQVFVERNKAVWIAEYHAYSDTQWAAICSESRVNRFNLARYTLGLPNNGGRQPCPTTSSTSW
jgi:Glycoside-hydrolase family GH114